MRHGEVGERVWIAALGEETLHEADLPACCRRNAGRVDGDFECPSCGALWQEPEPLWAEEDAFMDRSSERKGAA